MTAPRNIAHDKNVQQEKKHRGEEVAPGAEHAAQPGKKPQPVSTDDKPETDGETAEKDGQPAGGEITPPPNKKPAAHGQQAFSLARPQPKTLGGRQPFEATGAVRVPQRALRMPQARC